MLRYGLPLLVLLCMALPAGAQLEPNAVLVPGMHPAPVPNGTIREYHLYATDGWITMSDGTKKYVFGFNDTGVKGQAMVPGPLIWANIGDEVRVTLTVLGMKYRSDLADPHTIHLHGIHLVPYYDGFPESSFEIPMGKSFTYKFVAAREGSTMYHCHVEAVEHVQMGMFGPLVIYKDATKKLFGRSYDKEYIWVITELDSRWHKSLAPRTPAMGAISAYDQTDPPTSFAAWVRFNYRPDYWQINGMGFPDTIRTTANLPIRTMGPDGKLAGIQQGILPAISTVKDANGVIIASGKVAHAGLQQSALLEVKPDVPCALRIINVGYQSHPLHAHCTHFEVLGIDQTPLPNVMQAMMMNWDPIKSMYAPYERFTIPSTSGETWDCLYTLHKSLMKQSQSMVPGGIAGPEVLPPGMVAGALYDPTGFMWWPMHSHFDNEVADQGIYPSGMLTLIKSARTDVLGP